MTIKKVSFIFIPIIMIIFMVVIGILTRNSYINDVDVNKYFNDKELNYTISKYEEDITKVFTKFESLKNLDELEKESPIIVKAKVDSKSPRIRYYLTTLTTVKVLNVYKGKISNDFISVFEPIDIIDAVDSAGTVNSVDGYNWMDKEKEYILFLRPLKDSHYSDDSVVYLPTTTVLSKYQIDESKVSLLDEDKMLNGSLKYADIKNQEVVLYEDQYVDKFNNFKRDVLNKYN
ncbi:hypothetical protein [Aeribacillus sp. FSL K6-2833]|uniref:hypothetical protein n=1 Tax=Aeribacillus sp. FSL K6-2833 TaxID=2954611 RepID=UPI0030D82C15